MGQKKTVSEIKNELFIENLIINELLVLLNIELPTIRSLRQSLGKKQETQTKILQQLKHIKHHLKDNSPLNHLIEASIILAETILRQQKNHKGKKLLTFSIIFGIVISITAGLIIAVNLGFSPVIAIPFLIAFIAILISAIIVVFEHKQLLEKIQTQQKTYNTIRDNFKVDVDTAVSYQDKQTESEGKILGKATVSWFFKESNPREIDLSNIENTL